MNDEWDTNNSQDIKYNNNISKNKAARYISKNKKHIKYFIVKVLRAEVYSSKIFAKVFFHGDLPDDWRFFFRSRRIFFPLKTKHHYSAAAWCFSRTQTLRMRFQSYSIIQWNVKRCSATPLRMLVGLKVYTHYKTIAWKKFENFGIFFLPIDSSRLCFCVLLFVTTTTTTHHKSTLLHYLWIEKTKRTSLKSTQSIVFLLIFLLF